MIITGNTFSGQDLFKRGIPFDLPPVKGKPRKKILDSSINSLPIPDSDKQQLKKFGYRTVREAFRAALAGRLSSRRKGVEALEKTVLQASCSLLGHPPFDRSSLNSWISSEKNKTIAHFLRILYGRPFTLSSYVSSASIREILFPAVMHEAVCKSGVNSIGEILDLELNNLAEKGKIDLTSIQRLLVYVFDYLFIINEPEAEQEKISLDVYPPPSALPRIDIRTKKLLSPWFSEEKLTAGAELINDHRLTHLMFYRNGGAGLFTHDITGRAIVLFEEAEHIQQGFRISHSLCDFCGANIHNIGLCHHVAALSIAMLNSLGEADRSLKPFPLRYPSSPWYRAGQILYDLFGLAHDIEITIQPSKTHWNMKITHKSGDTPASWQLDNESLIEALSIFQGKITFLNIPKAFTEHTQISTLYSFITSLVRSKTEAELNDQNQKTIGQQKDESFWQWLTRQFYMKISPKNLQLVRSPDTGLFSLLSIDKTSGNTTFEMIIPRVKTPELIDSMAELGIATKLPPAKAFSKVRLNDENSLLTITPCLQLDSGEVLVRKDLEDVRYGRYYLMDENEFLPVREQKKEHNPGQSNIDDTQIPLCDIPAYITNHQEALLNGYNDVATEIHEMKLQKSPDHLEFNSYSMDDGWCYLSGNYGLGNKKISLYDLLLARSQGHEFIPSNKEWLQLNDSSLEWFHNLGSDRLFNDLDSNTQGVRLSRQELLKLSAFIPDLQINTRDSQSKADLLKLLNVSTWQDHQNIPGLSPHLRSYQKNGIAWLYQLYQHRLGGILADDMGLGKTHQALGFFQAVIEASGEKKRFLVICPASVVSHWVEKIQKYYPQLDWHVHHGSNRDLEKANGHSILITTYGITRRDVKELADIPFEAVIFDEIQQAKNRKSDIYSAAVQLSGKVIIGLTGTPLENSVHDLKALFNICLPGFLGSDASFKHQFAAPIEEHQDKAKRETLRNLIRPFLLRRTKDQVLTELPEVIEDIRTCRLSDDQVRLYREAIAGRGFTHLDTMSGNNGSNNHSYMKLLAIINYLKQICDHPCLVGGCTDHKKYSSGKWDVFVELLDECLANSMKVVVFSHYTKMLDIIEQHLTDTGIPFCGLRGSMTLHERKKMINKFNTDPSSLVFSASLLAGGVGVDLTAAQAVIHYDRWWNAAREDQATSRVHRMGQKHVVQVFKLVTAGTLEEKINVLIEKKRNMAKELIREDDAGIIKRLNREELIELLSWDE
ncbi:MAG: DEAD/DEAH box helicase [Proteobacteria bacterium]|nr:DEAD/DEAH box helicase [Pseudomonadota bacterium]MBU1709905.1 DEAD/DEAH box helicase [Pseudomonadota bacterium]